MIATVFSTSLNWLQLARLLITSPSSPLATSLPSLEMNGERPSSFLTSSGTLTSRTYRSVIVRSSTPAGGFGELTSREMCSSRSGSP